MAKTLIWIGLILTSLVTILIGWGLIAGFLLGGYRWPHDFGTIHIFGLVIIIIGLSGIILSWKRPLASSVLFIVNSLIAGTAIWVLSDSSTWDNIGMWSILSFPYLISGILGFISLKLLRKRDIYS
ncbi:MAG TPA: hypothetical protein DCR71_02380 [Dehalococcoidia bacterium]|nr:hypothetical protein [Dehalococcoidia bacterium]